MTAPDERIDERRLRELVDVPVEVYGETPNTSDWVRRRGHEGAPAGTFAIADELTAARGRGGSDWSAPSGGIWTSILLRPSFGAEHVGRLTFAGGLAVAETVRDRGVDARLEWPNDVVVVRDGDARKLAGVLTEAVVDGVPVAGKPIDEVIQDGELEFVVLGIGLNANLDPDAVATDRAVTTLRAEVGDVDRAELAADLHARVLDRAGAVESTGGFRSALADWRELSTTLGERVRVRTRDGEEFVGTATDVTERGALVVETDDGDVEVTEGECERLRPA